MKNLLLILLVFTGLLASAQTRKHPNYVPAPFVYTGQMYYTANAIAYAGTYIQDTIGASASINLAVVDWRKGIVATDSFSYLPIFGQAAQQFTVKYTKISGSPAVTVVHESSPDGVLWGPQLTTSTNRSLDTLTFTASGTSILYAPIRYGNYERLAIYTTSATQSGIIKASHNTIFPNYNATK